MSGRARSGRRCAVRAPGRHGRRSSTDARASSREAMEHGALGVASSLSGPPGSGSTPTRWWRCARSRRATAASTRRTCAPRARASSTRSRKRIDIGRRAHVPVDIIHLKIAEHAMWGQMPELVALIAGARAQRPGRGGQRVSLPRRAERSREHHSAVGARGRRRGDDRTAAGSGAAPAPGARDPRQGIPGTGTTTTRPPAAGRACCWCRSPTRGTSSSRASA